MTPPENDNQLHIVFVCTGNICRSPMAEIITRDAMAVPYTHLTLPTILLV